MGCVVNSHIGTNLVGDPSLADENGTFTLQKFEQTKKCSKCKESSKFLFGSSDKNLYLCWKCYPLVEKYNKCHNGHPLLWMFLNKMKECSICGESINKFFACEKCDYRVCTKQCKRLDDHNKELCPNNHKLIWKKNNDKQICQMCGKVGGSGYFCKIDNFLLCTENCRNIGNRLTCPNNHTLEQNNFARNKKCDVCKKKSVKVFECKICRFIICPYCKMGNKKNIHNQKISSRVVLNKSVEKSNSVKKLPPPQVKTTLNVSYNKESNLIRSIISKKRNNLYITKKDKKNKKSYKIQYLGNKSMSMLIREIGHYATYLFPLKLKKPRNHKTISLSHTIKGKFKVTNSFVLSERKNIFNCKAAYKKSNENLIKKRRKFLEMDFINKKLRNRNNSKRNSQSGLIVYEKDNSVILPRLSASNSRKHLKKIKIKEGKNVKINESVESNNIHKKYKSKTRMTKLRYNTKQNY